QKTRTRGVVHRSAAQATTRAERLHEKHLANGGRNSDSFRSVSSSGRQNAMESPGEMSMAAQNSRIEGFAQLFHHYYMALASDFECQAEEPAEWRELSPNERKRLVAATRLALMEAESGATLADEPTDSVRRNTGSEGRECGC